MLKIRIQVVVFWVSTPSSVMGGKQRFGGGAASIFRVEKWAVKEMHPPNHRFHKEVIQNFTIIKIKNPVFTISFTRTD
jgi:hypothetical protein